MWTLPREAEVCLWDPPLPHLAQVTKPPPVGHIPSLDILSFVRLKSGLARFFLRCF